MRWLCRLGFHRLERVHIRGFNTLTAVILDRYCTRAGCTYFATEVWHNGRRL